jgi:hypothetical protein
VTVTGKVTNKGKGKWKGYGGQGTVAECQITVLEVTTSGNQSPFDLSCQQAPSHNEMSKEARAPTTAFIGQEVQGVQGYRLGE